MDIPNTGAIFTLGKSYLAENSQSYFYIKNDPIKRLIAGPYQSAVICESGRLFVWGENLYGQLGIGGHTSNANNTNNNNTSNNNVDIIIKPTCVKSLKTLGLKIADIAFGSDWSVILTHSNELFFTGRNIFNSESPVSSNFTESTVNEEPCEIIRKPFRLEEFDDCLSNNEEAESFVNVLAGNEHFVVLTSFGRLIGWGSNESNQLGNAEEPLVKPHEIILDSPIKQFACGPTSTLVLTEKGNLFLTGHLNEFVFSNFTELQKNLSPNEQIIFIHISHASEIFIVTNTGSIYRSYESLRNKSLIFQRFYDYDSEENGPIWKLLKGTSFFAVLTRAHKFYTTFSESGHHLKTFREISKFKNLRLMDMALGDRHVLVHGVPRSSALAATMGPGAEHRLMSQSTIMANTTGGLMGRMKNSAKMKPDTILEETTITPKAIQLMEPVLERPKTNTPVHETPKEDEEETQNTKDTNNNEDLEESNKNDGEQLAQNSMSRRSPTESLKSRKSTSSTKKSLRPRTPFPETSGDSTPQTAIEKTPMRNSSYQAAMDEDYIDHTSPRLVESLENIPEALNATKPGVIVSVPSPPTEEDEQLTVEISETTDPLDHTVTINEIRFINNGIDVTANVKKERESEDSLDETEDDEEDNDTKSIIRKQADGFIENAEQEVEEKIEKFKVTKDKIGDKFKVTKVETEDLIKEKAVAIEDKVEETLSEAKDSIEKAANAASKSVETKVSDAKGSIETTAMKAVTGAKGAFDVAGENAKKAAKGAKQTIENVGTTMSKATDDARHAIESVGSNAAKATGEAKDSMGNAIRKMADDTRHAVGSVTSKISHEVQDAKNSLSSLLQGKKNKVDVEKPTAEIQESAIEELQADVSAKDSGGNKTNPISQSTNTPGGAQEDDERTTASVNSAQTSSGNPFESNNPFDSNNPFENDDSNAATIPYDPELDAMIQRSKKAFEEDAERASMATEHHHHHHSEAVTETVVEEKSKFSKFLDDVREKSKSLSCRNEKAVQIIEDQPPRYSVQDELALQPVNARPENGSKVCTIL
ncbi:uncharacterized protein [Musca autumnalis]|uniref:uncharacterized protein n=1 Tax=Musca autumnalis TaxID=221902 RepID=UPI003CED1521